MSRRARRNNNNQIRQLKAEIESLRAEQTKIVQGPQIQNHPPRVAAIELEANLREKYLGTGIIGFGPYLQVLQNNRANELVCQHGYRIFREMLADPEVDAGIDALVQASCSQPVTITTQIQENEEGYERAREIADFVSWNFEQLPIDDWRKEQLRQAIVFGNAVSEIDWGIEEDWLLIKRLRLQPPENYGFLTDRWGEVYGVVPLGPSAGTLFPLGNLIPLSETQVRDLQGVVPRYKLSIWTWEQKNSDPRGTSMLIPVYIPWWSKMRALEEWSCWLGRYAQPSIWGTPGPHAVPTCDAQGNVTQPTELLLQALIQFRSGSAIALPHGSQLELLEATGSVEPFLKSIELFNREITRALLGQHLATSEGDNQSSKAAEIHALILRQLVGSIRQFMIRHITNEIVKPIVQANFGKVARKLYPTVSLGDSDGFPPTVTEIAVLFQAGYFSSDQLSKLDKILGLPIRQTLDRVGAGNLPPYVNPDTGQPISKDSSGGSNSGRSDSESMGEESGSKEANKQEDG